MLVFHLGTLYRHRRIILEEFQTVITSLSCLKMVGDGMDQLALGWPELDALGSILGGVFAAIAVGVTVIVSRQDRKRRGPPTGEEHADPERARPPRPGKAQAPTEPPANMDQALRVHGTVKAVRKESPTSVNGVELAVVNNSDSAIHDVSVQVRGMWEKFRIPMIESGHTWSSRMREIEVFQNFDMFPRGPSESPQVQIAFLDNRGVRWRRLGHEAPERES